MNVTIKKSLKKGENFLWQNIQGNKKIFDIASIEVNPNINALFFQLSKECQLDHLLPVYVKLSHRDTIFKTRFLAGADDLVSLAIPEEFMAKELREEERFDFNFSQKNIIKIGYEIDFMKGAKHAQDFQLKDVSIGGFSCFCPEKLAQNIERFRNFKVSLIRQKILNEELEVDFVYAKKVKIKIGNRTIEMFRLGFKFKEKLKAQTLKELFSTSFQVI